MPTLKEILDKKEKLEILARQFGFRTPLQVFREEKKLSILVQSISPSISYKNIPYLEVKCTELIRCPVQIIDYEAVSQLQQDYCKTNSSAFEYTALKELFGKSPENIFFNPGEPDELVLIVLVEANKYLEAQKSNPSTGEEIPPIQKLSC